MTHTSREMIPRKNCMHARCITFQHDSRLTPLLTQTLPSTVCFCNKDGQAEALPDILQNLVHSLRRGHISFSDDTCHRNLQGQGHRQVLMAHSRQTRQRAHTHQDIVWQLQQPAAAWCWFQTAWMCTPCLGGVSDGAVSIQVSKHGLMHACAGLVSSSRSYR